MSINKILKMANYFEIVATKHHGYGFLDEPNAKPNFIMYKVLGEDSNGDKVVANIYAHSEEEAKDNFEMIYDGVVVKEVKVAKNLLK